MSTNQSETIRNLYYKVQQKKAEVDALNSKPNWVTNCAFKYDNKLNEVINIQTVSDVSVLIHMAGWLSHQEELHNKGIKVLGLPKKEFTWLNYTIDQWITDITTRVGKIKLVDKKKELTALEAALDKILPMDFRIQLDLEAIMNSDSLK